MTEDELLKVIHRAAKQETRLDLSNRRLSSLPPEIGNLTKLQSLDLWSNQLSSLPAEFGKLRNLKTLNLRKNQLSSLPQEIGSLTRLESLDVGYNQLSSLPQEIGKLTSLRSLLLEDNQLSSLPLEICQLRQLRHIDLRGNPIPIPPEILGPKELWIPPGDIDSILDFYFRTTNPEEAEPLYEAKLLIVGVGGAGKASLAKKIHDEKYALNPNEGSTEGINVFRWDFKQPNNQSFASTFGTLAAKRFTTAPINFFSPGVPSMPWLQTIANRTRTTTIG